MMTVKEDLVVSNRWQRYWPWMILVILILAASAAIVSRQAASATPDQPIQFRHDLHNQAGVTCLFCHPNALRSDIAGLPSVARCAGCHQTIATDRSEIQRVMGYWEQQIPIPWVEVNETADFVFFSHQPHLGAGVSCETCHGDVGQMTIARPVIRMDMGWCLDCHLDQPAEKTARLTDCLTCHK